MFQMENFYFRALITRNGSANTVASRVLGTGAIHSSSAAAAATTTMFIYKNQV
jgi:hypothetical protein